MQFDGFRNKAVFLFIAELVHLHNLPFLYSLALISAISQRIPTLFDKIEENVWDARLLWKLSCRLKRLFKRMGKFVAVNDNLLALII
jgi:hypothetical protein